MFYHDEINLVMDKYKNKKISKDTTLALLFEIEENAYKRLFNAEPDGDITYATACAVEKIYYDEEDI